MTSLIKNNTATGCQGWTKARAFKWGGLSQPCWNHRAKGSDYCRYHEWQSLAYNWQFSIHVTPIFQRQATELGMSVSAIAEHTTGRYCVGHAGALPRNWIRI